MDSDKIFITKFDTTAQYNAAKDSLAKPHVSLTKDDGKLHYMQKSVVTVLSNGHVIIGEGRFQILGTTEGIEEIEVDGVKLPSVTMYYPEETSGFHLHTIKYTLSDPKVIPNNFLLDCDSTYSVSLPNSVETIGDNAFASLYSLSSFTMGNRVESIGSAAFSGCTGLSSITLSENLVLIGDYAFRGVKLSGDVVIPNKVTTIGGNVFTLDSSTTITLGSSVASIGDYGISGVERIVSLATTAPTITSTTFRAVAFNGTLYVPQGSSGYDVWMQNANYYLGVKGWTMDTIDNMENIVAGGMD